MNPAGSAEATPGAGSQSCGPRSPPQRVLLISMPCAAIERPSIALGLLQAHCRRLGIQCETRYLALGFAERIGLADYLWLTNKVPYTAFAGEWLFAESLYGPRPTSDHDYVEEVLRGTWRLADAEVARLWRIRSAVEPFLDDCVASIPWADFSFVGFTSIFHQNLASLALAARVKRTHPAVTIAFGGANWEEAMGVALRAAFPFVDLAFSGESDQSFPAVLRALQAGRLPTGIPGVVGNWTAPAPTASSAGRVEDLNDVPVPDYDPFFEQFRSRPSLRGIAPTLLVETARGCWWGQRHHCTFCGLNGATMTFRSKAPARVIEEISYLHRRHGTAVFSVVDDILDMSYFQTVLPALAEAGLAANFFWEVKANLSREQVRLLRDAKVYFIQPGIESLSDHVLTLMRKGTTAFRNIELLKWCREYGVKPLWNLLFGFPGETQADYDTTFKLIQAIWHLDPPTSYGPVRLDRFSPYHADPAGFAMVNVRPMAPFAHLYPVDPATMMDIAYYFDFDYADGRAPDSVARAAVDLARAWMSDTRRGALQMRMTDQGDLRLLDTRLELAAAPKRAHLRTWKAAVYLACDRSQTLDKLRQLPEVIADGVSEEELSAFLGRCVGHQLMVTNATRWLSLAVHTPPREAGVPARNLSPAANEHDGAGQTGKLPVTSS
jgi:ribosomal peptide maturation radical SAM protein 1